MGDVTAGFVALIAVLMLPVVLSALLCLIAPHYAWEVDRPFKAWQFKDREVPEPSGTWLVAARVTGGLILVTVAGLILWLILV